MSLSRALSLRYISHSRARVAQRTLLLASQPALAPRPATTATAAPSQRFYATKGKTKSTASIVPGSKMKIQDPDALKEYQKAEGVMKTAVEWFRKECAGYETRASGRVTPAILSPVRVRLPSDPETEYALEALATVGVREGSTFLITLFEEQNMKHVESALHTCGIPGVVPHKHDAQTIKVSIPKPTVESRHALYTAAKKKAEEIRTQVRKQHSASLKRGKFEKHSIELEEFQKLTDKYIAEVDTVLKALQKATGAK
ncbi:ribosome recycling factor domain-containing protein [Ephemerocybe angulata]|uniref:Ribosome recycling factor domain-containing protein n=1 Tax=Ephemerocybe angulata TaxID=980116 RepID=A0A8H6HV11_9AGAR|nr:ribosome recycling factor domain-containing protein [Tulosesus angulatus]